MKKLVIAFFVILVSLLAVSSHAQFLSREYYPLWGEEYENYGRVGYRDALQPIITKAGDVYTGSEAEYDVFLDRRVYDPFGNYLIDGLDVFKVEEYRTIAPNWGSILLKSSLFNNAFRRLCITNDEYSGWSNKIIIGDATNTRFTPLTLSMARMNGVRWDVASHKNRFTVIGSRVSDPIISVSGGQEVNPIASYLYGGHWESTLGDVLTLGASYITFHSVDSFMKRGSNRGVIPSVLAGPKSIFVVFSDDSPEDGSGAEIYDVQMLINGIQSDTKPDIRKIEHVERFIQRFDKAVLQIENISHLRANGPWLSQIIDSQRMFNSNPSALGGQLGLFFTQGKQIQKNNSPLQANNTDVVIYKYDLPPDAKTISFRAFVANDYSIDLATGLNWENSSIVWGDWHNVQRAKGNPKERSNIGWVTFEYGFPTGIATYGLNLKAKILGAIVSGEYSSNFSYSKYPSYEGEKIQERNNAFYLKIMRPISGADIGVETFNMPPNYRTTLPIWLNQANDVYNFNLVDDNDDNDEWPDSWEHWDPYDPTFETKTEMWETVRDNLNPTGKVGYGVYPGLNETNNTGSDLDINDNGIPDYEEPFLMYYVEPDEFVYGDDFNNNGIVDAREDDNKPDYPYELDTQGWHSFINFRPAENLNYTIGHYNVKQTTGGGKNLVTYGKFRYTTSWKNIGNARINLLTKRVNDDTPDNLYQYVRDLDPETPRRMTIDIRPDLLTMRNSLDNILFLETQFKWLPNLNFMNNLRYEINSRRAATFKDGSSQENSLDRNWAFVSKADYTWRFKGIQVTPMFKYMLNKGTRSPGYDLPVHTEHIIPILRMDYSFTPNTILRVGVQGFPSLPEKYRNLVSPFDRFDRTGRVVLLQNRGNYAGYDLSFNLGYKTISADFSSKYSTKKQIRNEYFLQIYSE